MKTLLPIFFVLCSFLSQAQPNPLIAIDSLVRQGAHLETSSNFAGAIAKYKLAEALIKKNNLNKSYEALANSLIGYAYYNSSKFNDALKHLKRSAYCFELDSNTLHLDYCMVLHDIAVLSYFNLHQPIDSLCQYAIKACVNAYEVYEEEDPRLARFFDLVGLCKLESKDFPAAKAILLYSYELLDTQRDSLPQEFIEVCGHLATLYNRTEQRDSAVVFAKEKLKQAKKFFAPKSTQLAEAYYTLAFALNVGNEIDPSIMYLDSAQVLYPTVCEPKEKAEFYYRGGEYNFAKKDLSLAKHYFIQAGTYLANNKISNPLEGSCWLWVSAILLQELKITEAKPYCDKACEFFKKYLGSQHKSTLQVCQMADALIHTDLSQIDFRNFFPDVAPDDIKVMLGKLVNPAFQIGFGNNYTTSLLAQARLSPNFKELPRAMEAILSKKYKESIEIIQHFYVKIVPGYQDSLDYFSDPDINSPAIESNSFLLALLLKATAYDRLGVLEKDLKKLNYAWRILEKCDTLMSKIRINAANEDIGIWSGVLRGIYEQMIITSANMFNATQQEAYYDKTLFASERLKAFALLRTGDPTELKALVPAKLLSDERQFLEKTLQLRRDFVRSRQSKAFTKDEEKFKKEKEKSLQDSLFLIEANLATLRSGLKVNHPKYWEANNEKTIASVREIMGQLDTRTAIISYTCMIDETLSILVMTGSENSFFIGKPITGFKSMVATVTDYLAGKPISKAAYVQAAHKLFQELIVNLPASIERLIIIPDGFLHNLSFEALLTDAVDATTSYTAYPFLLKRYAISYGYSATLAYDQLKNKARVSYPSFLLGYSSPGFNDFKGVRPICDTKGLKYNIQDKRENATKSDLLGQDLKNYRIVHISAHGREASKTDILGIRLAGGEPIYYGDLYKLDIKADLFLLLACLSGKGNLVTGEGMIGLNRALYAAGARNVLLFRETLNNESNTLFCQKFYEEVITHENQSFSISLQKARKALMENHTYANPIYWAGYYLLGY